MKILILAFTLLSNFYLTQEITGFIKDSLNQKPIAYANVLLSNGKGVFSDENGYFKINSNVKDSLKISAYGYESINFPLIQEKKKSYNLNLVPKSTNIEEVILSKKINYKRKVTIGEDKIGNIAVTSLIGYETCVFIENKENIIGKIKSVFIDLKKRANSDYTAILNIKFYEYDSINDKPGKEISKESIKVTPSNKKYRLKIDTEDYNLFLAKKGICIGIEMIYEQNENTKYKKFGPAFRYTLGNTKKSITWSNYHNRGWKKSELKAPNFKTKNLEFSNPMIGIEVLYP